MKLFNDQFIVITGAAGFIGSGVIQHLNEIGIKNLILIDDLGHTEKWKNLVRKKFLDIIPIDKCFEWLEGRETLIKAIIHLGACSSTTEKDADFLLNNNYRFSQRLVQYALKNELRFIYASSAATYGDGSLGFSDDHKSLPLLEPLNMYGYSKHLFDLWLKNEGLLDQVVGLKYFNVFGPNEFHKGRMTSAVFNMVPTILKDGVVKLFKSSDPALADGDQRRDFIYVKDAVKMTCAFLKNDAYGIYNIGSGVASTWNQLSSAVFKALNRPTKIEYIAMPEDLKGKYQNFTCADMSKTNQVLKKEALAKSLEENIADYVQNYLIPGKSW